MNRLRFCLFLGVIFRLAIPALYADAVLGEVFGDPPDPDDTVVYKQVDGVELQMFIFRPDSWSVADDRPVIVFYFGGGWRGGSVRRLMPYARYFAERGMVAVCVDYRVWSRHGALPSDCLEDAKSAIRWLRINAASQGINPNQIGAAGDSAGGHLAASAALIEDFDYQGDRLEVSAAPNALILLNPVLDVIVEEERDGRVGSFKVAEQLSPNHNIWPGLPPTLVLHSTEDKRVPILHAQEFFERMIEAGNDVVLWKAEAGGHSFWVRPPWREKILKPIEFFLIARDFVQSEETR